jgi:CsoR family transcriptional regulator, copper-sensing transcriptional repressor
MLDYPQMNSYLNDKEQLLNRLRRIKGQIGGLEKMVEDERYCIDVLTQISAAQAALDKVAIELLDGHTKHCVVNAKGDEQDQRVDEMVAAIKRLMRQK